MISKKHSIVLIAEICENLAEYGIPSTLINAIAILYEHTDARIITPDGETEFINLSKGVQQVYSLAPLSYF